MYSRYIKYMLCSFYAPKPACLENQSSLIAINYIGIITRLRIRN